MLFIDLKHEQIKRVCSDDNFDAAKLDRTRTHIDQLFKEKVPGSFRQDPVFKATLFCEEVRCLFDDFYARRSTANSAKAFNANFNSLLKEVPVEGYFLVYCLLNLLALKICQYQLSVQRSPQILANTRFAVENCELLNRSQFKDMRFEKEARKTEFAKIRSEIDNLLLDLNGKYQVKK